MIMQLLGVIAGLITIVSGILKHFYDKSKKEQERKDNLKKAAENAVNSQDPSALNLIINRINNYRVCK